MYRHPNRKWSHYPLTAPLVGQWAEMKMAKPYDSTMMLEDDMAALGVGKAR